MRYVITKVSGPFFDGSKLRGQMFEITAESSNEMYPDLQFHVRLQKDDVFPPGLVKGNVLELTRMDD